MITTKERFEQVKKSEKLKRISDIFDLRKKKVLDIGCGMGEYLVYFGKDSVGITTTESEIQYGKENGLNIVRGNAEFLEESNIKDKGFQVIWANNLFEHVLSPHSFLMKIREYADEKTILILGVPVVPFPILLTKFSRFRGALATNHISFFTKNTLRLSVEFAGWRVKEVRSFWFKNKLVDRLFSFLAPHIFVVAEKVTDFQYPPKKHNEWVDDKHYEYLLKMTGQNK